MTVFWMSAVLLVVVSPGLLDAGMPIVARCATPDSSDPPYCSCFCSSKQNNKFEIRCRFQNKENVTLTKELVESYENRSLNAKCSKSQYVQIANASSLDVTSDFVEKWLEVPSSAFDIFHSGTVTLHSLPSLGNSTAKKSGFFAGIGISNCHIPELPTNFLRDQTRGALRIKQSRVGVIRPGFLNNVKEMRYIWFVDSEVEEVEGSMAAEGYITLSKREVHPWTGLNFSNVTIGTLGRDAFNLTHKSDMEIMTVENCRVSYIRTGALSARGDIQVSIKGNTFQKLEREAFKVDVTGPVYFGENVMGAEGLDAIGKLRCYNESSIQTNTILVTTPIRPDSGQPLTPFHPSCGKPKLFMVLIPMGRIISVEDTRVAWALGATLAVLGMMMVVGLAWFYRRRRPILSMDLFLDLFRGHNHKVSLENLPRNIELNTPGEDEDPEEGTSVKDLDLSCEPQEKDQSHLDAESDPQSVDFCDEESSTSDDQLSGEGLGSLYV